MEHLTKSRKPVALQDRRRLNRSFSHQYLEAQLTNAQIVPPTKQIEMTMIALSPNRPSTR